MKPAWDQLGDEFADSSSVLIGDVDCEGSGEEMCNRFEISGFPTLKYFAGELAAYGSGEDYKGPRDFQSLKTFVTENLEVKCKIQDIYTCNDKERAYIDKMRAKTSKERVKQILRLEKMAKESMKKELRSWLDSRLRFLRSLEIEVGEWSF
jgi:protein disulfide-isomerase A6